MRQLDWRSAASAFCLKWFMQGFSFLRLKTAVLLPCLAAVALAQDEPSSLSSIADLAPRVDLDGDPLPIGSLIRLGTTRFRHGDRVLAVAYATDGKSLVTASEDQTVRRWDAATGKELKRLQAPGFLALSADGSLFLSIDPSDPMERKNRVVRVNNTVTNREVGRFEWYGRHGRAGTPHGFEVAFSRDGTTLAMGSYQAKVILLWDLVRSREIRQIDYLGLDCLTLSADGKTLFTGPENALWDVASGKLLKALDAHYRYGGTVTAAFSADGKTLALGGSDASFRLFDVASGKQLHELKCEGLSFGGAGGAVTSLAFSADGKTLGVGSNDWTVRLWDVAAGKQLHQLVGPTFGNAGHHGSVNAVAFAPDGKTVTVASNIPMLRLWDTASGREVIPPTAGHRDAILALAFSRDGKRVASASTDLTIRIWDATSGDEIHLLKGHQGSINGIAFSPDGRRLVSVGGFKDETLRWWDTTTGENSKVLNAGSINDVAYAPDGKAIATASSDGIQLRDAETGVAFRAFAGRANHVYFSPDGRQVSDGTRIWSLATGELTAELKTATAAAFSPDWKIAVASGEVGAGGATYSARLLEVITDREILSLAKEPTGMSSATLSPDGSSVAIAENTGVRLWEMETGKEIGRLSAGSQSRPSKIAFAPDGRALAAVNSDTTILIWDIPPASGKRSTAVPSPVELVRLWEALAGDNAPQAFAATVSMIHSPELTVPFLMERIQPMMAPGAERLQQLIADLGHEHFEVREKAAGELEQLGELAEPALRKALDSGLSREMGGLVKTLLARRTDWSGNRLRSWRAIQILESIGTSDAQSVLNVLTKGAGDGQLTREALAALDRLKK